MRSNRINSSKQKTVKWPFCAVSRFFVLRSAGIKCQKATRWKVNEREISGKNGKGCEPMPKRIEKTRTCSLGIETRETLPEKGILGPEKERRGSRSRPRCAARAGASAELLCRLPEASRSGYYKWLRRRPSVRRLRDQTLKCRLPSGKRVFK